MELDSGVSRRRSGTAINRAHYVDPFKSETESILLCIVWDRGNRGQDILLDFDRNHTLCQGLQR